MIIIFFIGKLQLCILLMYLPFVLPIQDDVMSKSKFLFHFYIFFYTKQLSMQTSIFHFLQTYNQKTKEKKNSEARGRIT